MRTYYVAPIPPLQVTSTAYSTFTAIQSVSPVPAIVIPANMLEVGTDITIEADGEFSNTATPTLALGFFYGSVSTILAQSAAITTATTVTGVPWNMRWNGRVRAIGSTGTIYGAGILHLGTALGAFATPVPIPITKALRTTTVDTTAASAIGVSAAWSASSASNTISVDRLSVLISS